jgi:hypothetical protein
MPCGPLSFVVLDFDGPEGRKVYEEKFGDGPSLPPTASTPAGGYHAFFAHPNGSVAKLLKNAVRILPGVDIRCHGGYVIIPSAYGDGRCWIQAPDIPAPELPEWIIEALKKQSTPTATPGPSSEPDGLPPGVGDGERNATAAKLAGKYLAPPKNLSPEEATAILARWNLKNSPPLPEEEIRRTVFSIARKERDKGPLIELVDSSELGTLTDETRKKIIDPFLPAGSKAFLAAWQGNYKSTMMVNVAVAIRNGFPLFGRFDTTQGRVLYVDRENPPYLAKQRIEKISRGLGGAKGGIRFQFPKEKPDLAEARVREAYIRVIEKEKIDLAIFDSFLCYFNLRNENDNTEVRNVLELVSEIPARTDAAILFIDHASKASPEKQKAGIKVTPRGAGAKGDWSDLVMTLEERDDEARKLRVLRFPKTRFNVGMPGIVLEVRPDLVMAPSGDDEICPVFTVRQAVEDSPGIMASKLYTLLRSLTGCGERTAIKSTARAVDLGFIRREGKTKPVYYFPKEITAIGGCTNNEEADDEGEETLVYQ